MKYPFSLPALPYAPGGLAPYISEQTVELHYNQHHKTYLNNLNDLIKNHKLSNASLEEIIMQTHNNTNEAAIFNNAAQVWNHNFYWNSMKRNGGAPQGDLAKKITLYFGDYETFKNEFFKTALSQFGSGWAWLVFDFQTKSLKITKTSNASLPMIQNQKALITVDVWEHSYYLDYKNRRAEYLKNFMEHLINWDFAYQNLQTIN